MNFPGAFGGFFGFPGRGRPRDPLFGGAAWDEEEEEEDDDSPGLAQPPRDFGFGPGGSRGAFAELFRDMSELLGGLGGAWAGPFEPSLPGAGAGAGAGGPGRSLRDSMLKHPESSVPDAAPGGSAGTGESARPWGPFPGLEGPHLAPAGPKEDQGGAGAQDGAGQQWAPADDCDAPQRAPGLRQHHQGGWAGQAVPGAGGQHGRPGVGTVHGHLGTAGGAAGPQPELLHPGHLLPALVLRLVAATVPPGWLGSCWQLAPCWGHCLAPRVGSLCPCTENKSYLCSCALLDSFPLPPPPAAGTANLSPLPHPCSSLPSSLLPLPAHRWVPLQGLLTSPAQGCARAKELWGGGEGKASGVNLPESGLGTLARGCPLGLILPGGTVEGATHTGSPVGLWPVPGSALISLKSAAYHPPGPQGS
ncbi:HCLS1-associated protein X-1 isoform X2 [Pogoniulus pusillus]|uniref:HCLS1-associated protein X-1 isoform X2 n=1 Tax=Pogoniulus pusillus TaxID=488313 RepID=UPI0030B93516